MINEVMDEARVTLEYQECMLRNPSFGGNEVSERPQGPLCFAAAERTGVLWGSFWRFVCAISRGAQKVKIGFCAAKKG